MLKILPYQETPYYEKAVTDKFKELIKTGKLSINATAAIFYRDKEPHPDPDIEKVLGYQNRRDKVGFFLGCYPFTHLDKIHVLSSVMVLVALAELFNHLIYHVEKGYRFEECPYCNKADINNFFSGHNTN